MAKQSNKRKKVATETGIFLVIFVAIAVVVNVLSIGSNVRWDRTANEKFTLSEGSARLVSNLQEPILIDAYVTRGLAKLDVYVADLTSLLKEYEGTGNGKFKFTLIEAKTKELKDQAKEAGLQPMQFAVQAETGEDQAALAQGYFGLVLKYGSENETIQLRPDRADGLEFLITNKIREIRDKVEDIRHKIGILTGKDELKLTDTNLTPRRGGQGGPNIKAILGQHFPFYELVDVDLKDGAEVIDKELHGLVLTQPQKDYTDKELRRIDEFLMTGGKSLAVFASAVNVKPNDADIKATLARHNLDKLLAGYGLGLQQNLLLDFGAQFQTAMLTAGGIATIRHPPIAHVTDHPDLQDDKRTLDTGFAAFFRLGEAAFPYPSSIELLREKQPEDVSLKVVARTTPNTSVLTEDIDLKVRLKGWKPKPPFAQHAIAAVAEGNLRSAFAGVDGDNEGIEVAERSPEPSRVLLIASSQYITNPFAYSGNGPELGGQFAMFGNVGGDQQLLAVADPYAGRYLTNTILSVKNTFDWITGDSDLLAIAAKIIQDPNLKYASLDPGKIPEDATEEEMVALAESLDEEHKQMRSSIQQRVQWFLTLGVPLLFAALGIARWRMRINRQTSFQLS